MGQLKEYSLVEMTKRKVEKNKYVVADEILEQVEKEILVEKLLATIAEKGKCYAVRKKKVICGFVSFKKAEYKASDFEILKDEKKEKTDSKAGDSKYENTWAYEMDFCYLSKDLAEKTDDLRETCFELMKQGMDDDKSGVKAFIWGEEVLVDNNIGKTDSSSIAIGMCIGLSLGIIFGQLLFDNLALGMSIGMCIGLALGAANYSRARKVDKTTEGAADSTNAQADGSTETEEK